MKATVAVFVLLAAFAYAAKIKYAEEYFELIDLVRKECFDKENVHHKYLYKLDDSETIPSFEELKCHTLCVINKLELIDMDLQFLPEVYKKLFGDLLLWEKVHAILPKCLPTDKKLRTCENAYDLHVCIYNSI